MKANDLTQAEIWQNGNHQGRQSLLPGLAPLPHLCAYVHDAVEYLGATVTSVACSESVSLSRCFEPKLTSFQCSPCSIVCFYRRLGDVRAISSPTPTLNQPPYVKNVFRTKAQHGRNLLDPLLILAQVAERRPFNPVTDTAQTDCDVL